MARLVVAAALVAAVAAQNTSCVGPSLYSLDVTFINGTKAKMSIFTGQVLAITNVASFWGYTVPHYTSLNKLMGTYGSKGFNVLGMPSNSFGGQEPGSNDEILNILKYVRPGNGFVPAFPLSQSLSVNGLLSDPVWTAIRGACAAPVTSFDWTTPVWAPVTPRDISWNFETVLLDKQGVPFRRYASAVDPLAIASDIEALLAA